MYYIYHIKGVKIGCSKEPNRRVKNQRYTEFEILEQYDNIEIASKREIELQIEYGYKKDNTLYKQTISSPTFEGCSKGGKIGGIIGAAKIKELGVGIHSMTKEQRIELGKNSIKKLIDWNKNNPEHLKNLQVIGGKTQGKIQGNINKENGHMSRLGKQMTEYNNRVRICPYCGKESRGIGYNRWHGERCKNYSPLQDL
jgi:hypothetical protein